MLSRKRERGSVRGSALNVFIRPLPEQRSRLTVEAPARYSAPLVAALLNRGRREPSRRVGVFFGVVILMVTFETGSLNSFYQNHFRTI